ncbi:MAG: glycosyltransferase family 2 protein [bacterium]
MEPLSVAVVCLNEEDRIKECLESAAFADEIVVVDSGSADRTVEITKDYTGRVFHREWQGWKDQKKWAADQCSHEWVLTLDADEVISPELKSSMQTALESPEPEVNGYTFSRRTFYQGRWIRHCGWYPDRKLRLYKKSQARFGGEDPHEVIRVTGKTGHLGGDLYHYTYRDLRHHASQLARYAAVNANVKHKKGVRFKTSDLVFRPPYTFFKTYILKLGVLDAMPGFIISVMNGYYTFLKYARLWELGREKK